MWAVASGPDYPVISCHVPSSPAHMASLLALLATRPREGRIGKCWARSGTTGCQWRCLRRSLPCSLPCL